MLFSNFLKFRLKKQSPKPVDVPSLNRRSFMRRGIVVTLLITGMLSWKLAYADSIDTKEIKFALDEDGNYLLTAEYAIELPSRLEEALKAVPLFFLFEFELTRRRWYWLDEVVINGQVLYRLSFNALTRQYQLSISSNRNDTTAGIRGLTFSSLEEALRFISRVRRPQVLPADALQRGERYRLITRMRLDLSQLPKPFQLNSLTQREWVLDSETRRINVEVK
ncbi:MAG: DUF4390 domain-containing protein [Burkholderiaceae bacterium]|nr:DUF4390 domain-containing protein [Burkholderiaceae bacterium]